MTKETAAWLVLRAIGLVLLMIACSQLYEFVLNLLAVWFSYKSTPPIDGTLRLVHISWDAALNSIALFIVAIYFLRFGVFAFRLITYEGPGENT